MPEEKNQAHFPDALPDTAPQLNSAQIPLKSIVEGLLFLAESPLSVKDLAQGFAEEVSAELLSAALSELIAEYQEMGRAFTLTQIAGGYQFRTRPELAPFATRLLGQKSSSRLSPAALETLAIVAFRQPILRAEVEKIRKVDAGGMLKSLLEKGLIKTVGRKDLPGRPILYGTTQKFLETFDLPSLAALPTLTELEALESQDQLSRTDL